MLMRTEGEIKERRKQIKKRIAENNIWVGGLQEAASRRRRVILRGKDDEYEWLSGKNIDIRYGVTHL